MAVEYCRVQKKNFFGGRPRQEILIIEICTWNKETNLFLMFIRLPSEVPKIFGEGDVGRLCSSVVRAVDRQSNDLGSNPSAVESVIFSTERFSNSLNIEFICIICDIRV